MYLYYYLNEKYVGTVDIEVMFASNNPYSLIVTDEKGGALLGSLEMMYGKNIPSFTKSEAYDLKRGIRIAYKDASLASLPQHIYTTSKVGPVLKWDTMSRVLCA